MSGSEIALFSLSRFQLTHLKERSATALKIIKKLLADPSGVLITILICNEAVNITLSSIMAGVVHRNHLHEYRIFSWLNPVLAETLAGVAVTTPIILLFGEITPKVVAARTNQLIAPLTAKPLFRFYKLCYPFRVALTRVVRWITHSPKPGSKGDNINSAPLREEEFLIMMEEGQKEGEIHESEIELIRNVFELDDTPVSDIYTPLSRVSTVSASLPIRQAMQNFKKNAYSRIPVVDVIKGRKKIAGVAYRKDLMLLSDGQKTVRDVMKEPYVVQPTMKLNSVFRRLKQNRIHIAVVESDQGESLGIVTMTDILGALFEDTLHDDGDEAEA